MHKEVIKLSNFVSWYLKIIFKTKKVKPTKYKFK